MTDQETWFRAASSGDVERLKQALNIGADVNARDAAQNTALHLATIHAHADAMRLLIEHGADLDAQNSDLSTPLHLTAKNMETIRILLEAGADPNITDKDWTYPYYFAFYGSMSRELAELYIRHGAKLMIFPD